MQHAPDADKLRVLIVDNCRESADTLYLLTKLWGHDSMAVYDVAAALDLCDILHPDVMLVDFDVPGVDAIARAVACRGDDARPTLVVISGCADHAAARGAGFDHFLSKPIEPTTLEHFLDGLCAGRQPASPVPALTA